MKFFGWACCTASAALAAAYVVVALTNPNEYVPTWMYYVASVLIVLVLWVRVALNPEDRRSWTVLAIGFTAWTAASYQASITDSVAAVDLDGALFTLGYLGFIIGTALAVPGLRRKQTTVSRFSGYVAGSAAAALVVAVMLDGVQVAASTFDSLVETVWFVALAVASIAVVTVRLERAGWYPGRQLGLICAAIALSGSADLAYLSSFVQDKVLVYNLLDVVWLVSYLLLASAALLPAAQKPVRQAMTWRDATVPNSWLAVALVLVVIDGTAVDVPVGAIALAAVALLLGGVRAAVMFGAHISLLEQMRGEARHDALTGLPNRRALMEDLDEAFAQQQTMRLVLCDLNGFKAYNDTHGHQEGDKLLARVGDRLARIVAGRGRAYRLGGDEFCVLWRLPNALQVQDIEHALSEHATRTPITAAVGDVELPVEAPDVEAALRIADRRMYLRKADQKRAHAAA